MWAAYHNYRTITTLTAVLGLTLQIRRCLNAACPQFQRPYRPEEAGRLALPKHEFGLDVIHQVGLLRYIQHRSLPEIHQALCCRQVAMAPRTVQHLLERYEELVALSVAEPPASRRSPPRTGALSSRWMACNPTSGMKCAGSCAIVCPARCSSPRAYCRRPSMI